MHKKGTFYFLHLNEVSKTLFDLFALTLTFIMADDAFFLMIISIHIYSKVYPLEKQTKQYIFGGNSFLTLSGTTL